MKKFLPWVCLIFCLLWVGVEVTLYFTRPIVARSSSTQEPVWCEGEFDGVWAQLPATDPICQQILRYESYVQVWIP